MEFGTVRIYCELDALLDTRLATLYLLDPLKVQVALNNGYYTRIVDEFSGYDPVVYAEAYKNRDEKTLGHAMMTEAIFFINYFADTTLKATVSTPFRKQPELVLNTYPYRLEKETQALVIQALKHHTNSRIDIRVIEMPYSELTPAMLKEDFAAVIMYEYWNWLECHAENKNLEATQIPAIKFIAPALIRDANALSAMPNIQIFKVIEEHAKPFIGLITYPISKFSVDLERAIAFSKKMQAA